MGRAIHDLILDDQELQVTGAIERPEHPEIGSRFGDVTLVANLAEVLDAADVVVDFSLPNGLAERVGLATAMGKPFVCGVTGLSESDHSTLRSCATEAAVVYAPNFSVGVNVLYQLVQQASKMLGSGYDTEVIETHHRQKRDAPSGTAQRIVEVLQGVRSGDVVHGREGATGPRPQKEVGVHSVRAGDVVGEHTVVFGGAGERVELTHRASSRAAFASGVIVAVRFALQADPGLYGMREVLEAGA